MIEMFEEETVSVFDKMFNYAMTFLKCVGVFVALCFFVGWVVGKQEAKPICQPTKVVLSKVIYK